MNRRSAFALALALIAAPAGASDNTHFGVTREFAGPEGSYDYISVDDATGRVFVGREFGVMRLDPATGATETLLARAGVAAVLPIPGTRLMLSTNGPLNNATLFDRDSGKVISDIATGQEPDGAYYDVGSHLAFVMNGGSGDISVIDIARARPLATIAVGGTPEGATSDGKGRLFVNVEEMPGIVVIDIARQKIIGRYALADCEEPTGIAFDPVSGTLITACKNGVARLVDAAAGRDRGKLPIGQRADGSVFDPASRTGFIPCLDGTLTIYRLDARGKARVTQVLRTREGARTAAYDAARGKLYLPYATVERDAEGRYLRARTNFGVLSIGGADGN